MPSKFYEDTQPTHVLLNDELAEGRGHEAEEEEDKVEGGVQGLGTHRLHHH